MRTLVNRSLSLVITLATVAAFGLATGQKAQAVTREWVGADNAVPTVGSNWNTLGSTGTAINTADEARFTNTSGAFPTTLNVNVTSDFNPRYIGFSAAGSPVGTFPSGTGGVLGAIPNYTFIGGSKVIIGVTGTGTTSNGNIDTGWGNSGTVTFSNTGGIDMWRASQLYAGSAGGNSNLVISAGTPLRVGIGSASGGTVNFNAIGGNITVDSTAGVDFSGVTLASSGTRRLDLLPQAGKTITLSTGVTSTARLGSIRVGVATVGSTVTGQVVMGASPTQASWAGPISIFDTDLVIVNNDSLGAVGSGTGVTGYTQPSNGAFKGALILSNSVVSGGITSGETMYLGQRTTDTFAQIKNQSGNNKLTGLILADGTNAAGQTDQSYTLEAQGAVGVDTFELSGTIQKTTFASGVGTLTLRGSGSGLVSGVISSTVLTAATGTRDGGTWGVTKKDGGTWTLTGVNTYNQNTSIEAGTLALGGSGSIANSPLVTVKSGAFFDVTGLSGGTYTLPSGQNLKGKGTVVGNISAGTGGTITPGESAGTLNITGNLSLTGGTTLAYELSNDPLGPLNDKIFATGALTSSGTTTIAVTMTNGILGAGSYRLIDYTGAAVNPLDFNVIGVTLSPRQSSAVVASVPNQLNLDVTGGPATLTWEGGVNGDIWVDGTINANSVNWTGAADNHFYDNDDVIFGSSPTTTNTPVISGTVKPNSVTFNSADQSYTVTGGTINATTNLVDSANGNVTLNNSVTTIGGTSTLSGSGTTTFGSTTTTLTGNLTTSGAKVVTFSGGTATAGSVTIGGSGAVTIAPTTSFSTPTFNVTGSSNVNISAGSFTTTGAFSLNGNGTTTIANSSAPLSLPATVAVNSGTLALNRTDSITVANNFTGAGTIQKDNTNTVTATGDNSGFTGTTIVTNGILVAKTTNALTNTTVQNGATLSVGGNGGSAPGDGNGDTKAVSISGDGYLGMGALFSNQSTTGNYSHVGALTFTGDAKIATVSTTATSGYTVLFVDGPVTGAGKNLTAVLDGALGNSELDFVNNGNLDLNNISIAGGATVGGEFFIGGNTSITAVSANSTTGKITFKNNGRLAIYGSNGGISAWTGGTLDKPILVEAGANNVAIDLYLNTGASKVIGSNITLDSNLELYTVTSSSNSGTNNTLYNNTTNTITLSGAITGAGNLTMHLVGGGGGTSGQAANQRTRLGLVELTSDGNNYTGTTTIGGGGGVTAMNPIYDRMSLSIGNGGSTGSIGTGAITINAASDGGLTRLYLNRSGAYDVSGDIITTGASGRAIINSVHTGGEATLLGVISGPGSVIADGGVVTLAGNNTFTGNSTINAGRIQITHNNGLGANGNNNTSYVQFGANDNSALLLANNVTSNKAALYLVPHSTNAANVGPQIISVSGSNELTGTIASDSFTVPANNFVTIQSNAGSDLKLSGNIRQDNNGTINLTLRGAGNGEVSGTITQPGTGFFNGATLTTNKWNLIKEDAGTWKLSGANSYTGTTTVNNGTLLVNGTHTGGDDYTVNAGGTLGGTGTINLAPGKQIVLAGGTLSPGASIGTLTIGGGLSLTSGTFDWEFSGGGGLLSQNAVVLGADLTNVAAFSIASSVSLVGTDLGIASIANGIKLTVIAYTSGAPGIFSGMNDDTVVTVGGRAWIINYDDASSGLNGGTGTAFVTLTAVPEASSILVMGLGGVFAIGAVWLSKRFGLNALRM